MATVNTHSLIESINLFLKYHENSTIISTFNSVIGNRILNKNSVDESDFNFIGGSNIYASIIQNLEYVKNHHDNPKIAYILITDGHGNEPNKDELIKKAEILARKSDVYFFHVGHFEDIFEWDNPDYLSTDINEINDANELISILFTASHIIEKQ